MMAMATITAVEGHGIAGEEFPHDAGDWDFPCSQKEMSVVAEQRPCIAWGGTPDQDFAESIKEGIAIAIGPEDLGPVDPSNDHMVKRPRRVYAGLTWH
jgi:hypothetical protein